MIETLYTIGVYGSTEASFFGALQQAKIDLFCDVRQRRGVRGRKYAYVNSTYLQEKLRELHIDYLHYKPLAPTKDIRELQKLADQTAGVKKQSRETLGNVFIREYKRRILDKVDFTDVLQTIGDKKNVCFFCVERHPAACHRSLVVAQLERIINTPVINLMP